MLLGAMSCWPAAMSAGYRYYDAMRGTANRQANAEPINLAWYQLTRAAEGRLPNEVRRQVWWTATATVFATAAVVIFLGASDRWRRRLYGCCLVAIGLVVGTMARGAWLAWEVSRRVDRPAVASAVVVHGVLAGLTMAMALVAVGVSIRRWNAIDAKRTDAPAGANARAPSRNLGTAAWLLATALALVTAATGVGVAGCSWSQFAPLFGQPRDLAHMILAGVTVALMVTPAALMRRRLRRTIALAAGLLFVVLTVEIWVGVLMLYDGSDGGVSWYWFRDVVVQRR